jgi:succinoglycan biosynthesis transport protein ExoP
MSRVPLHNPRREDAAPLDDEIRLSDYADRLRRGWPLQLGGAIVGIVAALALYSTTPYVYEAAATLRVATSKVGEAPAAREGVVDFVSIVANQRVASEVVSQLKLGEHGLTPQALLRSRVFVQPIPASTLIRIRARVSDAALAAAIANEFARRAVTLTGELNGRESVEARDRLRLQLEDARKQFDDASERVATFNTQSGIEALKSDVDGLLDERKELLSLFVSLENARGSLTAAERERAARTRIDVLRRALDTDSEAASALQGNAAAAPRESQLQLRSEAVSETYDKIDQEVARLRTEVAGLEREWNRLGDVRNLSGPQAATLAKFYAADRQGRQLIVQRELAEQVFKDVASTYEKARLRVETSSATLQVVDVALTPDQPVAPSKSAHLAVGMLGGWVLGAAVALLRRGSRA